MWDSRYSEPGFAYGLEPNDFLRAECPRIAPGGRVLCLAEGEGRNAVFLARQGYDVTAVDLSSVGLKKAEQLAREQGVSISTEHVDLADYDLGIKEWDGIVSIFAHVPPAVRLRLHNQMDEALKPGGHFILEAFTIRQLEMEGIGGPPEAMKDYFMALPELRQELAALELLHAEELDRQIFEGPCHRGLSAVVQILGRKR